MKTFKQFLEESKETQHKLVEKDTEDNYILNSVFGQHSQEAPIPEKDQDNNHILNTSFGKHSVEEDSKISQHVPIENPETYPSKTHVRELHHKLSAHHDEYDEDDIKAINSYTTTSAGLNSMMHRRETGKISRDKSHPNEAPMKKVVHTHNAPSDMTVYSGIRHSPEHLIKHQKANNNYGVAETSHFMSTSIDRRQANTFAMDDKHSKYNTSKHSWEHPSHVLKIHVPKGHPCAYVAQHSRHDNEKELILPPKTKLHIHPHPVVEHTKHGRHVVWTAHVQPYEGNDK